MNVDRIKASEKFAAMNLLEMDSAHGMKHVQITANFAKIISNDDELCIVAALLHDIGRSKEWKKETIAKNHGLDSANKAKTFLQSLGFSNEEVNQICLAISQHCFFGIQTSEMARILWDADKLSIFSPDMEPEYVKYWKDKGWDDERINETITKERKIYLKQFYTQTAKDIAKEIINLKK